MRGERNDTNLGGLVTKLGRREGSGSHLEGARDALIPKLVYRSKVELGRVCIGE